ncbi:unnamed protein product [Adineta steineri]|uniref:Anoctamin n=1 Tax=Adineta steineri TaxID=433720 RepID=A0A813N850_9BILA|nr:unnamed protein product [Adineta steineri]
MQRELDDQLFVINTFLNIIWATGFLIFWRRRQAELAYKWNTLDMELVEDTRPTYKGQLRRSPITNKYEPYYPTWKRLLFRMFVTIPMIGINIILVSCVILVIIRFQSWIDRRLKDGTLPQTRNNNNRASYSSSNFASDSVLNGNVGINNNTALDVAAASFGAADVNHDGRLDRAEFIRFIQGGV